MKNIFPQNLFYCQDEEGGGGRRAHCGRRRGSTQSECRHVCKQTVALFLSFSLTLPPSLFLFLSILLSSSPPALSRSNTLLPVCSARSPHLKINLHAAATTTTAAAATQQLLRQCPVPPLPLPPSLYNPYMPLYPAAFTTYNSNKATASLRLALPACLRAKFHFHLPRATCCCFLPLSLPQTHSALLPSLCSSTLHPPSSPVASKFTTKSIFKSFMHVEWQQQRDAQWGR